MQQVAIFNGTNQPANQQPAAVYLAGLAESGRRAMAGRLRKAAELLTGQETDPATLPWHQLRYSHVQALREQLLETYEASATVNMTLCAVRGVAREAFNLELMPAEAYARIKSVKPAKGSRLPAGRSLSVGEVGALLAACDDSPVGHRDAALVALMYAGGLRRAEVVSLCLGDYDTSTGELRVRGKGNKQRNLYVCNGAADALADWLAVRGEAAGPLFLPVRRGGRLEMRNMTPQAVYGRLRTLAKKAGVQRFSPHDLRRSFVSELLDAGADIATVAKLAGHASVTTTARYDRRGEASKRKAVSLLHVPYRRKPT